MFVIETLSRAMEGLDSSNTESEFIGNGLKVTVENLKLATDF